MIRVDGVEGADRLWWAVWGAMSCRRVQGSEFLLVKMSVRTKSKHRPAKSGSGRRCAGQRPIGEARDAANAWSPCNEAGRQITIDE
jgi:hypothetical protein